MNQTSSTATFAAWLDKHQSQLVTYFFIFAAVLIFIGLGMRSPWPADEPRFAQVAKEMVESGQWLFPSRGGEYYPDKPPVFMWSIALFYWLTGSINLAFLLPSALCGFLTLFLVFDIGKRLWNEQTGLIAAALLLFSFQFVLQAKAAQIDAMVCCWITCGCYGLLRFFLVDGRWRWYFMAFFFMGLGVITKGVGFLPVLMLIPYGIYRFISRQQSTAFEHSHPRGNALMWLAGLPVLLLAIALWLVPMLLAVDASGDPLLAQYRDNILFRQTVTRYADSWHHIKPFWYYVVSVIPAFWLPLSLALPWLVPQWVRACKQRDARILLPLFWIVLVLLFFSASPGKRGVYVLPALPMLALIAAPYAKDIIARKGFRNLLWALVLVLSAVLLIAGIGGLADLKFATKLEAKFDVSPWLFFTAIGAVGFIIAMLTRAKEKWIAWAGFMSLLWVGYSTWGYVLLEDVKTPKNVYENIQATHHSNLNIALVEFSEQFILFSPYPITHFGYHTPVEAQLGRAYTWLGEGPNRYLLIDIKELKGQCFTVPDDAHMGFAHRADWVLLSAKNRLPACEFDGSQAPEYHYQPKL